MTKKAPFFPCLCFLIALIIVAQTGCSWLSKTRPAKSITSGEFENEYALLLSRFSKDDPGKGHDRYFEGIEHQPMAYGLIISAEASRFGHSPGEESCQYIRNAVHWLLDNRDLDDDQFPGWGLPDAWDAFGDGTINPKNHPYTITTAICLLALLDALRLPLWDRAERRDIIAAVGNVSLKWCRKAWTDIAGGGFFWFSPNSWDAFFAPNVSAMFLGSLSRALSEQKRAFSKKEYLFIKDRVDRAAAAIVSAAIWRQGAPFWNYIVRPGSGPRDDPNDLIHHVYILWGMELYRSSSGKVNLPWSSERALRSLDRFWKDDKVYDFPQDVAYTGIYSDFNKNQARLWGIGSALAFYAKFDDREKAKKIVRLIAQDYGPFPNLHLLPEAFSKDENFYTRDAAHILWGLAILSSKNIRDLNVR